MTQSDLKNSKWISINDDKIAYEIDFEKKDFYDHVNGRWELLNVPSLYENGSALYFNKKYYLKINEDEQSAMLFRSTWPVINIPNPGTEIMFVRSNG